jgi:hypothetical protein
LQIVNKLTQEERGYGSSHKKLREAWARRVAAGGVICGCGCGTEIRPGQPWDLGHDRSDRRRYTGPEHRAHNRATSTTRRRFSRRW